MKKLQENTSKSFSQRLQKNNLKPLEDRILDATLKLMTEKGFSGCKVNEIAYEAEVTEPTIYQYFEGKEDLLFKAVERQAQHTLIFQEEHLQGIAGAYNKLRKLIWAHLRYNDLYREYLTLVLLECRSNLNFYQSRAYKIFRHYSGAYLAVLAEGIQEGVFCKELDIRVVRDLILGLLDFEAYTVLVTKEIQEATPDHDDIMRLLDRILLKPPMTEFGGDQKRNRILEAAIKLFSENGYFRATIADIAKHSNVSEGTVYEYFKNKEDLLLTIPEERFKAHVEELEETFDIRNSIRKLKRFIRNHFRLYLDDKPFLIIYLLMIQLNRRFYASRAYRSLQEYIQVFENIVIEGIDDGSFLPNCNVRVFRNMLWGAFTHMSLRWFIVEKDHTNDVFSEVSKITNYLCKAVATDKAVTGL